MNVHSISLEYYINAIVTNPNLFSHFSLNFHPNSAAIEINQIAI